MSWLKVDDRFWSHPKVIEAGNEAVGAWIRVGSYSSSAEARGYFSTATAKLIAPDHIWETLERVRLIDPADGGWCIHNFERWNPWAKAEATKAARSAAGRRGGQRSGEVRRSKPRSKREANAKQTLKPGRSQVEANEVVSACNNGTSRSKHEANEANANPLPLPLPIHLPSEDVGTRASALPAKARRRGSTATKTRIPADGPEFDAWATQFGSAPTEHCDEFGRFVRHHRGKGNAWVNWPDAWANWLSRANQWASQRAPSLPWAKPKSTLQGHDDCFAEFDPYRETGS